MVVINSLLTYCIEQNYCHQPIVSFLAYLLLLLQPASIWPPESLSIDCIILIFKYQRLSKGIGAHIEDLLQLLDLDPAATVPMTFGPSTSSTGVRGDRTT